MEITTRQKFQSYLVLLVSFLLLTICSLTSASSLSYVPGGLVALNEAGVSSLPDSKLDGGINEALLLRSFGAEAEPKSGHSKKNLATIPHDVQALLSAPVPSKRFVQSEAMDHKKQKLNLEKHNPHQIEVHDVDMSNLLEQNCAEADNITQRACFEYCTSLSLKYETGRCVGDQNLCVCENSEDGSSKRVKLYKPKSASAPPTRKRKISHTSQSKLVPLREKGDFDCDNSPEANSICQVFCTTRGGSHSACSLDQKACLCFKTQSKTKLSSKRKSVADVVAKRSGRNMESDGDDPTVEKLIGLGLVIRNEDLSDGPTSGFASSDPTTRQLPYWSPPFQLYPQQHMQSPGCTPLSCVGNCPRHCDNLCTQNLQCFCSCPEDTVYYDYIDDGPVYPPFSFFG